MNEDVLTKESAGGVSVETPKRVFDKKEHILAWLSVAVGYLYCRAEAMAGNPIYSLIFTALLFLFGFVFLNGRGVGRKRGLFYPISALILNISLFTSGSTFLNFWVSCYGIVAFFMWCQTRKKTAFEPLAGALYFYELLSALIISPILSFLRGFQAIAENKAGKKAGKILLFALIGLFLAVLPTIVVYALLSFDDNFTGIIEKLLNGITEEVFARIVALIFGIPVGMLFYGALSSSAENKNALRKEQCEKVNAAVKFAPQVIGAMALLPILLLYIVFIVAQKDYYAAVLTGTLPEAETFSSFSRDGFFRLCVVAALNAIAVAVVRIFTKKTEKGRIAFTVRAATVLFSLVTIVMSATAISQMMMYVSAYGLTELRVYALWFMGLIAVCFFVALLAQFIRKLPFAAVTIAVVVLFFSALTLPDCNAIIARHNYNCYLNGAKIDVEYLADLGDSGVPTLVKLMHSEDEDASYRATCVLSDYLQSGKTPFRLSRLTAKAALDDRTKEELTEWIKEHINGNVIVKTKERTYELWFDSSDQTVEVVYTDHDQPCGASDGEYALEGEEIVIRYKEKAGQIKTLRCSFELKDDYTVWIDGKRVK